MADVVVVGGGIAGLTTAGMLARRGMAVDLVERDAPPRSVPISAAREWRRRGVPHFHQAHVLLAPLRVLLAERLPAVLDQLWAVRARDLARDGTVTALACRRSSLEAALWAEADAAGVRVVTGTTVSALAIDGRDRVSGVHTVEGSISADEVVLAAGARAPVDEWISAVPGLSISEERHECDVAYVTRNYRLERLAPLPTDEGPVVVDAAPGRAAVFPGDDRTFAVTFNISRSDRDRIRRLRDADAFDRAARELDAIRPWIERSRPSSGVLVMARMQNRIRTLHSEGGVATGLHLIGDALLTTNPVLARGCWFALAHGLDAADALMSTDHRDAGPLERSNAEPPRSAFDHAVQREQEWRDLLGSPPSG